MSDEENKKAESEKDYKDTGSQEKKQENTGEHSHEQSGENKDSHEHNEHESHHETGGREKSPSETDEKKEDSHSSQHKEHHSETEEHHNTHSQNSHSKKEDNDSKEMHKDSSKSSEEDDDAIDFSAAGAKIAGFFKRFFVSSDSKEEKKKSSGASQSHKDSRKEAEINEENEGEGEGEGINLDLRKTAKAAGGFLRIYAPILLLLAVLIISNVVRMQPYNLSGINDQVKSNIYQNIKQQFANQIRQQQPGVPDSVIQPEVNRQFLNYVSQPGVRKQIDQQAAQYAQQQKAYFSHDNNPNFHYMPDIDPYYWLYYAHNIIDHGSPGDTVKNGQQWDSRQLAPNGRPISKADMGQPYFIAGFYKILHAFDKQITPERAEMWYPIYVFSIILILIFIMGTLMTNMWGGFFAALMASLIPGSLSRTLFGRGDTDTWVIFFMIVTIMLFMEAFTAKKTGQKMLWGGLAGLSATIYSRFWGGWWYAPDFLLGTAGVYVAYQAVLYIIRNKKFDIKDILKQKNIINPILFSLVFVAVMIVGMATIGSGLHNLLSPLGVLHFSNIKAPTNTNSFFPNVLTTVAELNPAGGISQVISATVGSGKMAVLIFLIAIAGVILSFFASRDSDSNMDPRYAIILTIWLASTIYATHLGVRFALMLAPAIAIAFGVAIGYGVRLILSSMKKQKASSRNYAVAAFIIVVLLVIFFTPSFAKDVSGQRTFHINGMYGQAMSVAKSDLPLMDDTWWNLLTSIKDNTPNDTIITSWWDFGHQFKEVANRPVTFDGTTQGTQPAHWVGEMLITKNESKAIGIVNMLDCSGNEGFDNIERNVTHDQFKTLNLINALIPLNKSEAQSYLQSQGYNARDTNLIMSQVKCNAPEGVIIASADMIGKASVWGHFGLWDFQRAYVYNLIHDKKTSRSEAVPKIQSVMNVSYAQANSVYDQVRTFSKAQAGQWIANYPQMYGTASCTSVDSQTLRCDARFGQSLVPIRVNLTDMTAYIKGTNQGGQSLSANLPFGYMTKSGYKFKQGDLAELAKITSLPLGASLIRNGGNYSLLLSDPDFVGSIFERMYYYDGEGLRCFDPFRIGDWPHGGQNAKINAFTTDYSCGSENNVTKYNVIRTVQKSSAGLGDTVKFDYAAYLDNGTMLESTQPGVNGSAGSNFTFSNASVPNTVVLGSGNFLKPLETMMAGMPVGSTRNFKLQSNKLVNSSMSVYYNSYPNATINFKVRVDSSTGTAS